MQNAMHFVSQLSAASQHGQWVSPQMPFPYWNTNWYPFLYPTAAFLKCSISETWLPLSDMTKTGQ